MMMNKQKRAVYFWNLIGNVSSSLISVIYLVIVSRLLSAKSADMFSIAYSIGSLWYVIGLFQVRNYQSTDVQHTHRFLSYAQLRVLTITGMIVSIFPYLYFFTDMSTGEQLTVVCLMIGYRAVESWSDLIQGSLQLHERLDIAGRSMFVRYVMSALLMSVTLWFSKSLVIAMIVLVGGNALYVVLYEIPVLKQYEDLTVKSLVTQFDKNDVLSIMKACFPLFLNGFLMIYIFNEAKLVIERGLQEGYLQPGMQRDYNILFMPVFFMSLCILVIRPLITQLAVLWKEKKLQEFSKLIQRIVLVIVLLGGIVTLLAYFIGAPILSIVFGVPLYTYSTELAILICAGVLYSIAIILENVLTILRKHYVLVWVYILCVIVARLITEKGVYTYGMIGASMSFLVIMNVYVISVSVLYLVYRKKVKNEL